MNVEWLILADAAQVNGNKLYLLGGGWDRLTIRRPFPVNHVMTVAASFRVSWNDTNQKHDWEIEVVDADGSSLGKVAGQLEAGRPAGVTPGQDQRIQIAVGMNLRLQREGTYSVVARLNGESDRTFPFSVVQAPGAAQAESGLGS